MVDLSGYAIEFAISNETFEKDGQSVSLYENKSTGEVSKFGISLKFLQRIQPSATADDIRALTERDATNFYRTFFWDIAHFGLLESPLIAAKTFDLQINMGQPQGVVVLQRALSVPCDGLLGIETACAANSVNEQILCGAIVRAATSRYQAIHDVEVGQYGQRVADNNLQQWITRLHKMPPPYEVH
jgi:lysozyme family protein